MSTIVFFDIETVFDKNTTQDIDKLKEKYENLEFSPEVNKILTICVGYKRGDEIKIKNLEGDEAKQIKEFFELSKKYFLCGFNIKNFDIPFICKRALHLGIEIPNLLKFYGKKPWEITNIIDLFEAYRMGVYGSNGDLDTVCKHLGIISPKEEGISGSDVQLLHDSGNDNMIIEYCKRDVESCIKLYEEFKRLNFI